MHYSEVMIFLCSSIRRCYPFLFFFFTPVITCWCLCGILRRVLGFRRPHPKTPVAPPVLRIKGTMRSTADRGAHSPCRGAPHGSTAAGRSRDPADARRSCLSPGRKGLKRGQERGWSEHSLARPTLLMHLINIYIHIYI